MLGFSWSTQQWWVLLGCDAWNKFPRYTTIFYQMRRFFGMNIIMFNLWFGSIHILMGSPPVPNITILPKKNKQQTNSTTTHPSPSHHSPLRTHPKSRHCIGKTFNSCNRQLVRLPCFYQHHLGVETVWWTKHPQTTGEFNNKNHMSHEKNPGSLTFHE